MPGGPNNRNTVVDTTGVDKRSTLWRLFKIVMKNYEFSFMAVAVCIVVTACTTLASTLFTRTLIDDYITPMIGQAHPTTGRWPRRWSSWAWYWPSEPCAPICTAD